MNIHLKHPSSPSRYRNLVFLIVLLTAVGFLANSIGAEATQTTPDGKKPLTLQDIMKFKSLRKSSIAEKGDWVIYQAQPGRGNGEVIACHIETGKSYSIPRGANPIISKDSRWIAAEIQPDALELEKETKKDKLKPGLALLDTANGVIITLEKVKGFVLSDDSQWLVYRLFPEEKPAEEQKDKDKEEKKEKTGKEEKKEDQEKKPEKPETSPLILRHLASGKEIRIEKAGDSALDPSSRFLAYSIYETDAEKTKNGLYIRHLLKNPDEEEKISKESNAKYTNLTWSKTKSRLAFIFHEDFQKEETAKTTGPAPAQPNEEKKNKTYVSSLMIWDGLKERLHTAVSRNRLPQGWILPSDNKVSWTKDEKRLFFGLKPLEEYQLTHPQSTKKEEEINLYDIGQSLEKRELEVWHWNDPLINPQQQKQWEQEKKRIYPSVYHFEDDWFVHLADNQIPELSIPENPEYALGFSARPYQKELTWDDLYNDFYLVNLKNGSRQQILTRHQHQAILSPQGRFVVYYKDKHWFLYNIRLHTTKNLSEPLQIPFYDEDHDTPDAVPGYGTAGWTENDQSVLIYDKYDIWQFFTDSGEALCITGGEGRKNKIEFRIKPLDREAYFFEKNQDFLLSAFSHEEKFSGFYSSTAGKKGVKKLLQGPNWLNFLEKAQKSDRVLYTRERADEFPDLWISDLTFKNPKKISTANPQMENFLWCQSELLEWQSLDGIRLQGVVLKPENFDPHKRYPVLVYFYEISSDRLHRFNEVVINHRPCFPYYAGNGYVLFLPDIKFEVGRPGLSAVKCLVPGVQKLISLGIADPKAIALHGHSWSGYQTAFIITQTNIFAAAIAGAPVSNMTSAYNGIRWGSGMARQFQYEKSQSRIGPGFIAAPELYIQNSPVFFADRIHTPLLIEFGDQDEAVPWYQGIELYLTMRRLNKDCIFLQYNNEPHHLKKYPNKLDYTIKMKEYLDHYLKGEPAPDWISTGVPYKKDGASPGPAE